MMLLKGKTLKNQFVPKVWGEKKIETMTERQDYIECS